MKKRILFVLAGGAGLLAILSFNQVRPVDEGIPEEIGAILQTSCFGCHNSEARSDDAKKAVQFDQWDNYSVIKKISILEEIGEVLEEGKMPPPRFLENNPDKKPSKEHQQQLVDWTKKESERLMKGD